MKPSLSEPSEHDLATRYQAERLRSFPVLTSEQLELIRRQSGRYHRWYKAHPRLHNSIGVFVISFLLICDYAALRKLPFFLVPEMSAHSPWPVQVSTALICGIVHGFVGYNLVVYTIHEGGAHNAIIQGSGEVAKALRLLANNVNRLMTADPVFYKNNHIGHHAYFATDKDGSFTNFVYPARFYRSFLPFASFLDYNDFRVHAGQGFSASRLLSLALGVFYMSGYAFFMIPRLGSVFTVLTLLVFSIQFAFLLDRLREGIEHNLMPLDRANGTRNFGLGFWGMLIGGGPWGQPCHLSHHLAPALPWYQQLLLHRKLTRLLTPAQKDAFFLRPGLGFPRLVLRVFRESRAYVRVGAAEEKKLTT